MVPFLNGNALRSIPGKSGVHPCPQMNPSWTRSAAIIEEPDIIRSASRVADPAKPWSKAPIPPLDARTTHPSWSRKRSIIPTLEHLNGELSCTADVRMLWGDERRPLQTAQLCGGIRPPLRPHSSLHNIVMQGTIPNVWAAVTHLTECRTAQELHVPAPFNNAPLKES